MAGPVINEYILGNYLIYKLHPRITVSMDSRIDAYGERLHRQYLAAAEGSPNVYPDPPKHMIVTTNSAVGRWNGFLQKNPDWRMIRQDSMTTIYSRDRSLWPRY